MEHSTTIQILTESESKNQNLTEQSTTIQILTESESKDEELRK